MGAKSKKHHYVPQSLLNRFSVDSENKEIFVFNKHNEKSFRASILNTGSENHYNSLNIDGNKFNLEFLYQEIDQIYHQTLSKILNSASFEKFTDNDFVNLTFIVACQLKRTNLFRSTIKHIDNQLNNTLKEVSQTLKIQNLEKYSNLTDDEVKAISILTSVNVNDEMGSLLNKGIYLLKNETTVPFIISDCPVVLHNSFPYGGNSLESKGVEIYFPIGSKFIVGFCCTSLLYKIEQAKKVGLNVKGADAILKSVIDGMPIEVRQTAFIEYYNQLQIINSYKFIYSNSNNFDLVHETIKAIPSSKNRTTTITMSGLGKAPKPNKNLPKGDILIIYGQADHNMLPIEFVKETGGSIIFRCLNKALLEIILQDFPLQRIEYFRNQSLMRIIGKPEIIKVDEELYEFTHADKGLKNLFDTIKAK